MITDNSQNGIGGDGSNYIFETALFANKKKTVHTTEILNNTEIPTTKLASRTALTVRRVERLAICW